MNKENVGVVTYNAKKADDSGIVDTATLGEWLTKECGYDNPGEAKLIPCSYEGKRDWFEVEDFKTGEIKAFHCSQNAGHTHQTVIQRGLKTRMVLRPANNGNLWWYTAEEGSGGAERGNAISFGKAKEEASPENPALL